MAVILLIIGLLAIVGLVILHEFGHFIFAKRNGVEIEEFGIFFPPKLFSHKTKQGWDFTINLLPLGGFVRMKGEHDSDTEKGSFGAASNGAKARILVAGVMMNLLAAFILFTISAFAGMPQLVNNQVSVGKAKVLASKAIIEDVIPGSPAAKAGIKSFDSIQSISLVGSNSKISTNTANLHSLTEKYAGQKVYVHYQNKQGKDLSSKITLLSAKQVKASLSTNNPQGYLGVEMNPYYRYGIESPYESIRIIWQLTSLTFQGLGHAIGGLASIASGAVTANHTAREHGQTTASSTVGGPIYMYELIKDTSALGVLSLLFIIAYISLVLAIMNVLPFPALDGGRLWINLGARIIGLPFSRKREEMVNAAGFVFLIMLSIYITVFIDVKRFF